MNTRALCFHTVSGLALGGLGFVAGFSLAPAPVSKSESHGSVATPAATVAKPSPVTNPAATVARIARLPACASQAEALGQALLTWAESDPRAALQEARQRLRGREEQSVMSAILAAWARRDAPAAWAWARVEAADNPTELDAVLSTVGALDANTAWRWAREFAGEHGEQTQAVYAAALRGINYAGDYETAARLLAEEKWPVAANAAALAGLLGSQWGRYDPAKAAEWAKRLPPGEEATTARLNVGQSWMESDPAGASRYAREMPPGEVRQMLVGQAVTLWIDRQPNEALAWVDALGPDPDYDEAVAMIATTVPQEPQAALDRAREIFNEEIRLRTLGRILVNWQAHEPAAAQAYLAYSPALSDETRRELSARIKSGTLEKD
jgi:hypothetical protein